MSMSRSTKESNNSESKANTIAGILDVISRGETKLSLGGNINHDVLLCLKELLGLGVHPKLLLGPGAKITTLNLAGKPQRSSFTFGLTLSLDAKLETMAQRLLQVR